MFRWSGGHDGKIYAGFGEMSRMGWAGLFGLSGWSGLSGGEQRDERETRDLREKPEVGLAGLSGLSGLFGWYGGRRGIQPPCTILMKGPPRFPPSLACEAPIFHGFEIQPIYALQPAR
jgi:hypothetical protein